MKKKLLYFSAIVAAALCFSACQREKDVIVDNSKEQVTFTFTAEKVVETRTAAVEGDESVSYKWTNEDLANLHLYLISTTLDDNNNEKEVQTEVEEISIDKETDTKLKITATVDQASSYTFRAMLFAEKTDGGSPKLKTTQTPNSIDNYDPNADILVSEDLTTDTPSNLLLSFDRKVVINKMTVKGLTAGEKVDKVVISSNNNITGYYSNGSMSGQFKSISLIYSKEIIPTSGEFPVYFVTIPGEGHTLSVSVFTDAAVYSKSFGNNTINFTKGSFTRFGVKSLTREEKTDLSGTYVLTDAAGANIALPYVDGANNIASAPASFEDGVVYYDPDKVTIDAAKVTLAAVTIGEKELYTIAQDGKYLYADGTTGSDGNNQNYLKAAATIPETDNDGYYWEVAYADGAWSIVANRTSFSRIMQMNTSTKAFACYGNASQTAVALYSDFAPTPVITASSVALVDGSAITSATDLGASFNSNTATVTAAAYDDETLNISSTWLSVSVTGTTVKYTASANNTGNERVAYVKIVATNSDNRTVSKTIEVSQPSLGSTLKTDHITYSLIGVSGTSYSNWSGKKSLSDAVYAGNSAGGNTSVQLRSTSPSGIVSTTSGGKITKVVVAWNSNAANGRTLDIYGSNTAYSGSPASSALYSASTSGTKLGSIVKGTSTELVISGNYKFIGLRSNNGAMYIDDIAITWDTAPEIETVASPSITVSNNSVSITCATEGASIYYTIDNSTPTSSSTKYSSPIILNEGDSYTIKAIAIKQGYNDSEVVQKSVEYVSPGLTATAILTGEDMSKMSNAGTTYGNLKSVTVGTFTWESNGFQGTVGNHGIVTTMLQLRKRDHSSGVSYVKLPTFPGYIQSITMDVTAAGNDDNTLSDGVNPTATIAFQAGTTSDEDIIVSGKATNKSITLDLSSGQYKTGYIVAGTNSTGYRIWNITVVYNN